MKNLASVMGQAKQMKERMERLQIELAAKTVEGESGAGAVRVVVNGKLDVLSVRLDRPLLTTLAGTGEDADIAVIEDLITAATNAALEKARSLVQQEMSQLTGGMDLSGVPGLDKLLGG